MGEQTEHRSASRDRRATRLILADGESLFLSGVRAALELDGGFDIVGETTYGPKLLPLIARLEPEAVLLNPQLPGMDGIDCLDRIAARPSAVKVVMLSASNEPGLVSAALTRGACGYIMKSIDSADLGGAIRQALDGTSLYALGQAGSGTEASVSAAGMTERELEIVRAVSRGLSNKAVGEDLWITEQTVKFHLTKAYRKLGVRNRTEAARWAISQGLEGRSLVQSEAA